MADIKLNPDSDDVGIKFKIIAISLTIGLNVIVLAFQQSSLTDFLSTSNDYFYSSKIKENGLIL